MKKICLLLTAVLLLALLAGCGEAKDTKTANGAERVADVESTAAQPKSVDVDLTALSSTMVYSEVYNMMSSPEKYVGKSVRMAGKFVPYTNQDETLYYPAVVIADATACCSQGLEFVLKGDKVYPQDYPAEQSEVTVRGIFQTYYEGEQLFCHLIDAELE